MEKWKLPIESVSDKLIMSIDGLKSPNSWRKIDYPEYTTLAKNTITLDDILQNCFKKSFVGGVLCENCSSVESETIKTTFTMCINLK